ncbi:hypothetical protein K701_07320 [Streptomyces fradiae ATCC 10745 = DSM 40063]|uniref:Uncharacterized protein n=1 Tax=Streptomyces fradiae ATCC 10745 = DSM 40063 TaxID=1319510 RepID=A0ABQ6XLA6_STRFR|nr:hypothetical protein K701_28250 [Streptomyces fradiae ATCC 10745 = DSM 40063]KAF0650370.1 hypothetical protein K701_07320 [Streptomyces fradiae ATCC 10745 = DSM 40063]
MGVVEHPVQGLHVGAQPLRVGPGRRAVLGLRLGGDQVAEVRGGLPHRAGQGRQVGDDLAGAHQMDAGEQGAEGVQQRLRLAVPLEEPPPGAGESPVVVGVVGGDQAGCEGGRFGVRAAAAHDQGGQQLLQDVAVAAQHQPGELPQVVGAQVHLHAVPQPHAAAGLLRLAQPDQRLHGQQVRPAQVHVGVAGGEAVQVGAGDGGEDQAVGLLLGHRGEV